MTLAPDVLDAVLDDLAARVAARLAAAPAAEVERERWRLFDLEETAAMLGRSTRWVRERVKRGELPFVKLDGGALAFELEDVQAFVRARRVDAAAAAAAPRAVAAVGRDWIEAP